MAKLTTLLILISFMQISVKVYSQGGKLDLNVHNVTISEVFEEIEDNSAYLFFYDNDLDDLSKEVTLNTRQEEISSVLHTLLTGTDLTYEVRDNFILVQSKSAKSNTQGMAQQRSISGTVNDEEGEPLPGATVVVKGTTIGTVTNVDGTFVISGVPENAILEFTFIGFKAQSIGVGSQTTINVSLMPDAIGIEEVVAVGYATQKKANVTGSVASVESDQLTAVPTANINANLGGRLPGLIVDQAQGRPGANTASISVRGFGANNVGASNERYAQNESALVIVDGMERDFSQLDPHEIESITILKDASAAVYGIRGAAGVILVTTKKGKVGKPVFTYNGSYSLQQVTNFPDFADFQSYYDMISNHPENGNADFVIGSGLITPEREAALLAGDPGTNWWDVTTRPFAPLHQHNINASGGTEHLTYFFSLGYLNEGAIWESKDFDYERYNVSMNVEVKPNEYLSSNLILGWRHEYRSRGVQTDDFRHIAFAVPGYPSELPDDKRLANVNSILPYNPVAITTRAHRGYNDNKVDNLNASLDLKFNVPGVEGLQLIGFVGINHLLNNNKVLNKQAELWFYDGTNYIGPTYSLGTNSLSESNKRRRNITTNFRVNFNRTFGDHSLNALVLWEGFKTSSSNTSGSVTTLLSPELPYFFAQNGDVSIGGNASEYGRSGFVGRVNYAFGNRYLLEASIRRDGSSYFPEESRFGWFPGVSIGWNIHNEGFMADAAFINRLKIRASVSQLGNDGANAYDYIVGYQILTSIQQGYEFGGVYQTPIRTLGVANPEIAWQRSNLYNVGLETSFLDNKLSLEVEGFYRYRFDLLASDPDNVLVPGTAGVDQPLQNLESRSNRGIEAIIGYKTMIGNELNLHMTGNISWAREKYEDYIEPEDYGDEDLERISRKSGQWVNRQFGYIFDGFFADQAEIDNARIDYSGGSGNGNFYPGDIKALDTNGDRLINNLDQVLLGKGGTPELMFGLNTQLTWNGFDVTVFLQGASGFSHNFTGQERTQTIPSSGVRVGFQYIADNIWTPENKGKGAEFPVSELNNNSLVYDKYLVDVVYLRVKNLVLGYTLPKHLTNSVGISNLRIYLSGSNLLTFDNLGVFPFDAEATGAVTYPAMRTCTLGVNLSF